MNVSKKDLKNNYKILFEKYNDFVFASPWQYSNEFVLSDFKNCKKKGINFKKIDEEITNNLLNIIDRKFGELFWKKENIKAQSINHTLPLFMKVPHDFLKIHKEFTNDDFLYFVSIYNKKKIKLTRSTFLAFFYEDSLVFFNDNDVKGLCDNFFKDTFLKPSFCKDPKKCIYNIDIEYADKIVLWLRTYIYLQGWYWDGMKTTNLVKMSIDLDNGKTFYMYSLMDLGIKNPEFNDEIKKKAEFIDDYIDLLKLSKGLKKNKYKMRTIKISNKQLKNIEKLSKEHN
jgi:hypothetical protein